MSFRVFDFFFSFISGCLTRFHSQRALLTNVIAYNFKLVSQNSTKWFLWAELWYAFWEAGEIDAFIQCILISMNMALTKTPDV